MNPLAISWVSHAVIVGAFISNRYTYQIPLYIYQFFPYISFTLMLVSFWLCCDGVQMVRASQDVMGSLLAQEVDVEELPYSVLAYLLLVANTNLPDRTVIITMTIAAIFP